MSLHSTLDGQLLANTHSTSADLHVLRSSVRVVFKRSVKEMLNVIYFY